MITPSTTTAATILTSRLSLSSGLLSTCCIVPRFGPRRTDPVASGGDAPDTLGVVGKGTSGLFFAVKRSEVLGVGDPALGAIAVDPQSIRQPDRVTLLAPRGVAVEQLIDRRPA